MAKFRTFNACAMLMICAGGVCWMGGCGGDAADAVGRVTGSQPRCKTPAEVIERFNQAHVHELVDVTGVLSLMHHENEWQRSAIATLREALPLYELDATLRAEYGVPLERCPMEFIFAPIHKGATLADEEEHRATATFIDCNARQSTLYLTKQGSAWFISGYTLEHDPNVKQAVDTGTLLAMNRTYAAITHKAPSLKSRLKAGEFRSATTAKAAILEAAQSP